MTTQRFILGNVHDALDRVEDASVSCIVTSPPYWGRRNYTGTPDEIGLSQSLDSYLDELTSVFNRLWGKLQHDALVWVVIGDTASGSGGAGGDYNDGGKYEGRPKYRQGAAGIPDGQWCDVPGRLLHRLQGCGWLLRADICWDKGRTAPESIYHVRRPLQAHERIFMLAKSKKYTFNADIALATEPGDVWHITPAKADGILWSVVGSKPKAPFPSDLVDRCLAMSPAGPVLDPFVGSGMTLARAAACERDGIGIDLDPDAERQVRARFIGAPHNLHVEHLP